jgi:hypothetical protein
LKTILKAVIPPGFIAVVGSTKSEGGDMHFRIKVPLAAG